MMEMTKAKAQKLLRSVPNGSEFHFCDENGHLGYIATSLGEFSDFLEKVPESSVLFHAKGEINDFQAWITNSVKDTDLARAIARLTSKEKIAIEVKDRVSKLKHHSAHGISKNTAMRMLGKVNEGSEFHFCDENGHVGYTAGSLEDFDEMLREVPAKSVNFHLREEYNDFEAWVRNAVGDDVLADKLSQFTGKKKVAKKSVSALVSRRVSFLRKVAGATKARKVTKPKGKVKARRAAPKKKSGKKAKSKEKGEEVVINDLL
jgi:hypothetical protein